MTTLETDCDKLWREIIKERAGRKCQVIGCKRAAAHSHHIARKSAAVRWLLENGFAMCLKCHNHDNEAEMNAKIIKVIGQDKFDDLHMKKREIKQWWRPDLIHLRTVLREILAYYRRDKRLNGA